MSDNSPPFDTSMNVVPIETQVIPQSESKEAQDGISSSQLDGFTIVGKGNRKPKLKAKTVQFEKTQQEQKTNEIESKPVQKGKPSKFAGNKNTRPYKDRNAKVFSNWGLRITTPRLKLPNLHKQ